MAFQKNSHYFDSLDLTDIYDVEKYEILSPKDDDEWPQGKIRASDLAIGTHFDWASRVSRTDKNNFKTFLNSITSPEGMKEYILESECMTSFAEILRANSVLIDGR